jgi:hypothetical protein
MKVDQYEVLVYPNGGHQFIVYVGAFNSSQAWYNAQQMYPNASCFVQGKV